MVPAEVEPGAGADLENPEPMPGSVRDLEETTKQRRAAPDLVGLTGTWEQVPQL